MTAEGRDYYSIDEVRAIMSRLSHADQVKLRRIAHYQAKKVHGYDADELLTEGITRVIEGRRNWPRGLEVAYFMKRVFGSIISSQAKHDVYVSNYEVDTEVDISGDIDSPDISMDVGSHSDPSGGIYAQEMLQRLMDVLTDDQPALAVAMSIAEGLKAKEAQQRFNLSVHQFDAARNRLRRRIKELSVEEDSIT